MMKTTEDYAKECNVLLVDDEDQARDILQKILQRLFKDVFIAEDGKDGIEKYKQHNPDIIITDLNMPKMSGLDMIAKIREDDIEQKIIILSAHDDHSFFEKAINYKTDGYLIKPIDMKMLIKAVDNSVRLVVQKRELEDLNQHLEKRVAEEIEKNSKKDKELISTLTNFLELSPNPIIVYENSLVRYVNNKFLNLVGMKKDELLNGVFDIESIFEKREGYISTLAELSSDNQKNAVSTFIDHKRNIFIILQNEITVLNSQSLKMFTLNDITVNEYQKLKIKHYSQRLEDYIKALGKRRASESKAKEGTTAEMPSEKEILKKLDSIEITPSNKSRKKTKLPAKEYAKSIDSYTIEGVQELSEIEAEIKESLWELEETKNIQHLYFISERLLKYSSTIGLLFEFEDLSFAVASLAGLIKTLQTEDLSESRLKKIDFFLTNILLDLSSWREAIFIDQDVNDIHYLDSSLFSAILQFELVIQKTNDED